MARKHLIGFDSCINKDGNYEMCWYCEIESKNQVEMVEQIETFTKRLVKSREYVASNVIIDILNDFGIDTKDLTNECYEWALKRLKNDFGKEIVVRHIHNLGENYKKVAKIENGGDIFLSKDNYVMYVEVIELWQEEKRTKLKI